MRVLLSICAALVCLVIPSESTACGDKLVALGGGVSFERITARRPVGDLVMLMAPTQHPDSQERARRIQSLLERAGHNVHLVNDPRELVSVLETRQFDLVLSNWPDERGNVGPQQHSGASHLLQVSYADTFGARAAGLSDENVCLISTEQRPGKRVSNAVSELLKRRDRGLPKECFQPL
jgi:hypothetical protein